MSANEASPALSEADRALRARYTVVYEGDSTGVKILSGEPAVGRAVTVMAGDLWEEVRTLRAERDKLRPDLAAAVILAGEHARARGEAEGRLRASEMVGVVEGWRDRALKAETERDEARKDNDYLRASLANGGGPCAYCKLPKEDWSKCAAGFPGCDRADDAMLCPHVGGELAVEANLIDLAKMYGEACGALAEYRTAAVEWQGEQADFNAAAEDSLREREAEIAALRALQSDGAAASGWRPIRTAPRDGTEVMLYRPLAEKSDDPVITIRRTAKASRYCWPQTIPAGCDGQNFTEGSCYATHWMPLPAPPALAQPDRLHETATGGEMA